MKRQLSDFSENPSRIRDSAPSNTRSSPGSSVRNGPSIPTATVRNRTPATGHRRRTDDRGPGRRTGPAGHLAPDQASPGGVRPAPLSSNSARTPGNRRGGSPTATSCPPSGTSRATSTWSPPPLRCGSTRRSRSRAYSRPRPTHGRSSRPPGRCTKQAVTWPWQARSAFSHSPTIRTCSPSPVPPLAPPGTIDPSPDVREPLPRPDPMRPSDRPDHQGERRNQRSLDQGGYRLA